MIDEYKATFRPAQNISSPKQLNVLLMHIFHHREQPGVDLQMKRSSPPNLKRKHTSWRTPSQRKSSEAKAIKESLFIGASQNDEPNTEVSKNVPPQELSGSSPVKIPFSKEECDIAVDFIDDQSLKLINSSSVQLAMRCHSFKSSVPAVSNNDVQLSFPPDIFTSLCICDSKLNGNPIQMRSSGFSLGPRGLQVGACEFLNLSTRDGDDCTLSSRPGADGRPYFILEYYTSVTSRKSSLPAHLVVAQMDVTKTIRELATNYLKKARIAASSQQPRNTPPDTVRSPCGNTDNDRDSAIVLDYDDSPDKRHSNGQPSLQANDMSRELMNWLEVASEDFPLLNQNSVVSSRPPPASLEIPLTDPDICDFHDLIASIAFFYKYAFTLRPAKPGKCGFWKIESTTPALFLHEADLVANLAQTAPETLILLGESLTGQEATSMQVRWGVQGMLMWIYCVPMFWGKRRGCWLCFLVDEKVPNLWRL